MEPGRQEWRIAGGCVVAGLVAVVALYREAFAGILSAWADTTQFQFLFLVPVVSIAFLWRRLPAVRQLQPQPTALGLLLALPCAALWLIGAAGDVALLSQAAAVGMLQAVILTVLGWRVCLNLLFPLLVLWLMVPAWDLLMPAMVTLTLRLTLAGLRLAGLPATADGTLIVAGDARYAIVDACAGLDFVLGNLLVSLVFANLIYRRPGRKFAYTLAAVPVAIVANGLRTTSVVLLTAAGIDLAADHILYGWFLFLMAMSAQMAVGLRWRESGVGIEPARAAALPRNPQPVGIAQTFTALAGVVLAATLARAYDAVALGQNEVEPIPVQLCLPPTLADSGDPREAAASWRPVFPRAGARLLRVSHEHGRAVDVFVAYYWQPGAGGEMIGWGNAFFDETAWHRTTSEPVSTGAMPREVISETLAGPPPHRRLVWSWYWVDGRFTARAWRAKLLQARALLFGGDTRAAAIAMSTTDDGDASREALRAALLRHRDLEQMLQGAARADRPGRACN